jgi:hypothetical protein
MSDSELGYLIGGFIAGLWAPEMHEAGRAFYRFLKRKFIVWSAF